MCKKYDILIFGNCKKWRATIHATLCAILKKGGTLCAIFGISREGRISDTGSPVFFYIRQLPKTRSQAQDLGPLKKQKGLTPSFLYFWCFAIMSESPFTHWVAITNCPTIAITHPAFEGVACGCCDNLACG